MLDILNSHVQPAPERDRAIARAVSQAVHLAKAMTPSKWLEFLILLSIKLEDTTIPLHLAVDLRRSFTQAASVDVSAAVRLLNSVLPDTRFITRLMFAGIGDGIAKGATQFLSARMLDRKSTRLNSSH